jgi:hypothetical protein
VTEEHKLSPIQIKISSFQSIDHLEFEVMGFTCITGPTNIGKSAIMRAVSRSIMNDPVVGMVRKGSKFCTVELKSEKWGFKWEKGERDVNRYTINDKVLDKTGQSQLPQIAAMGFGSVKIGPDELQPWWADQYSPVFLLNKPGPQITDFISEISKLGTIQDAIVAAARGKKYHSDIAREKADELNRVRGDIAKIEKLTSLERLSRDLELQRESIGQYEKKVDSQEQFLSYITTSQQQIEVLSHVHGVRAPSDGSIPALVGKLKLMQLHHIALTGRVKDVMAVRGVKKIMTPDMPEESYEFVHRASAFSNIESLKTSVIVLETVKSVSTPPSPKIGPKLTTLRAMQQLGGQVKTAKDAVDKLSKVGKLKVPEEPDVPRLHKMTGCLSAIQDAKKGIASAESELKTINIELKSIDKELAKIPVCRLCGRPSGEQHSRQHKDTVSD